MLLAGEEEEGWLPVGRGDEIARAFYAKYGRPMFAKGRRIPWGELDGVLRHLHVQSKMRLPATLVYMLRASSARGGCVQPVGARGWAVSCTSAWRSRSTRCAPP